MVLHKEVIKLNDKSRKKYYADKNAKRTGRIFVREGKIPATKDEVAKGNFHLHNIHHNKDANYFPSSVDLVAKGRK